MALPQTTAKEAAGEVVAAPRKILGALHQVLGNFTSAPAGSTPAGIGIAANVYVEATGLSSAQFNALVPDSTGILP
ncbi:MAG: hypothetical protein DMG42_08375 [Acidobacteria bacterium]|nr:MAG: hypothetical protein DMG42_08375 [Acidobacteriota bacterium]